MPEAPVAGEPDASLSPRAGAAPGSAAAVRCAGTAAAGCANSPVMSGLPQERERDGTHARRAACRCPHCGSYDVWARRPRGGGAQERDQHAIIGSGTAKGGAGGGGDDRRGDAPALATEPTRDVGWLRALDVGSLVALHDG